MIKFHPSDTCLVSFVEGTLPFTSSIAVSAHCDMCLACRLKSNSFTDSAAQSTFLHNTPNDFSARDYVCMFEFITRDDTLVDANSNELESHWIELDGRKFELPATLARLRNKIGGWSHLVGKIWNAPIDIGEGCMAQLMYMDKGGSVPEHTHKGNETTLVISGQFSDHNNCYETGDYIALNQNHTHMPASNADEGCLVMIILDKPLHFTAGWAKLINPLSHLYFKASS